MPQGMFQTGPSLETITAEAQVPEFLKYRQMAARGAQELGDATAPWIKENLGYESPQRKMKAIAANTDLSDGKAVQKTFNALMQMNPRSAQQWLQSVKPVINQHIEQQKMAVTLRGKAKDRRIVVQNGIQYYVDTGERVLPRAPGKQDKTPAPVKHINKFVAAGIKAEIDDGFGGSWSNWFGSALPGSMTEESLIDFIHRYTELNPGETTHSVMNKIVEFQTSKGTTGLDATKPITASTPGGQTTPPSSSNPFNVPAQPK